MSPSRPIPMRVGQAGVDDLRRFVEDDRWLLQQKVDGVRAQVAVSEGRVEVRNSRGGLLSQPSATTSMHAVRRVLADLNGAAFDGELVGASYWVFDLLAAPGLPPTALQQDRLRALQYWFDTAGEHLAPTVRLLPTAWSRQDKARLVAAVRAQGGEGLIARHRMSVYRPGGESRDVLKVKFTHTIDCVVAHRGDQASQSAALLLHDEDGTPVEIGRCSLVGKPDVPDGAVVEVRYLYVKPGHLRLVQPRMIRLRPDKRPQDCRTSQLHFTCVEVVTLDRLRQNLPAPAGPDEDPAPAPGLA